MKGCSVPGYFMHMVTCGYLLKDAYIMLPMHADTCKYSDNAYTMFLTCVNIYIYIYIYIHIKREGEKERERDTHTYLHTYINKCDFVIFVIL